MSITYLLAQHIQKYMLHWHWRITPGIQSWSNIYKLLFILLTIKNKELLIERDCFSKLSREQLDKKTPNVNLWPLHAPKCTHAHRLVITDIFLFPQIKKKMNNYMMTLRGRIWHHIPEFSLRYPWIQSPLLSVLPYYDQ